MRTLIDLAAVAVAATATGVSFAEPDGYRRLGEETRRVELGELETRPFDASLLAALEDWSGEPLTAESLEGNPMVVLAWDDGEARSVRMLPTMARLDRTLGEDVIVLAVHGSEGWESARRRIAAGRVNCLAAHDASGKLLGSLRVDDHPNIYLIDRAGHVRVADIDPRDLEKAVYAIARETPEQAIADLSRRQQRLGELRSLLAEAEKEAAAEPETFEISGSAYREADWPEHNTGRLGARDVQGQTLPAPLGSETWLTPPPERPVDQHVLVLDFWATWCGPCLAASPLLEEVQARHAGEAMVLAISGQARAGRAEDEASIRAFLRRRPSEYWHLNDTAQTVYRALGVRGIPHAVVMSTDGVVRWQGHPGSGSFNRAVEQVVRVDPLLIARREAEAAREEKPAGGEPARRGADRPDG